MRQNHRRATGWMIVVIVVLVGGLFGCESPDDSCADVFCSGDATCFEGICISEGAGCDPECPDGEVCDGRRCVAEHGGCDHQGQACQSHLSGQWLDGFLCMDWQSGTGRDAICSRDCRTQGCPSASQCFAVVPGIAEQCGGDDACSEDQICFDGQCVMAACRSSECDVADDPAASCDAGERCGSMGNDLQVCIREGAAQPGENCVDDQTALDEGRYIEGCVAEAMCVGGICQTFCDDGECGQGEQCVTTSAGGVSVDVCGRHCDPGSEQESCDAAETCVPGGDGGGICRPAGSIEAFESCISGGEGCEPGTICAHDESGEEYGRCLPVCDLSAGEPNDDGSISGDAQTARDATCPQAEAEEGLWMVWHLAQAGPAIDLYLDGDSAVAAQVDGGEMAEFDGGEYFDIRSSGWVEWEAREAGAPVTDAPVAEGEFDLGAGQTRLLALTAEAGRDRALEAEVVDIGDVSQTQWVHGISDLERVDLWAIDEQGDGTQWFSGLDVGESVGRPAATGIFELRLVAEGAGVDGEILVSYAGVEFSGDERFVALHGTIDDSDVHSLDPPLVHEEEIPDIVADAALTMSCRAVNGGTIGGCVERCDGALALESGRCRGSSMGCGSRYHEDRTEWTTVCEPVGESETGEACNPLSATVCAEGLYCQEYGNTADHIDETNTLRGRCAPICEIGDGTNCGDDGVCRPITGAVEYELGECRTECDPGGEYEDLDCPAGQRSCRPEAALVPSGDGVSSAYEIEEQPPVCWASGDLDAGETCSPGDCTTGTECIFERSVQSGFVESMLSPYFSGGAAPRCRPICDPFAAEQSAHECGTGETCLFNYPWNADVGHCASIEQELDHGDPCDDPGLACGEDSICVMDGGTTQCTQFCQFVGQGADGYAQSTCPSGYECGPLIADIGICG